MLLFALTCVDLPLLVGFHLLLRRSWTIGLLIRRLLTALLRLVRLLALILSLLAHHNFLYIK